MPSINHLDDWILENIFQMLPFKERLSCKTVNKRWYNILMKRKTFREDRCIYINTSEIIAGEAPMAVLMEAKIPYEIYKIRDDTKRKRNNDLLRFIQFVGSSAEKMIYTGNGNFFDILNKMTSLRFLVLPDLKVSDIERIFSALKTKKLNFTFKNLEIGGSQFIMENSVDHIKSIKQCIPPKCDIILSHSTVEKIDCLIKLLELVKNIKDICIILIHRPQEQLEKLLQINDINCNRFRLNCSSQHRPFSLLETLQNKHKNMKDIELTCHCLPPIDVYLPKITSLTLKLNAPNASLKSLENLPNLRNLKLCFGHITCGFGHDSLCMPKLKQLDISEALMCNSCVRALSNSFKNLEEFSYETRSELTWIELKVITRNWVNNLSKLTIWKITNMSTRSLTKMSVAFPNLKELTLISTEPIIPNPLSQKVKAVLPAFRKLTYFSFTINHDPLRYEDILEDEKINEAKSEELRIIFDYLDSMGLPIQDKDHAELCFDLDSINLIINRERMTSQIDL